MKFSLKIECEECGSFAAFEPKRTTIKDETKIYEDYSSIEDGISENQLFSVSSSPDTVNITCKICGNKHDLTI